MRAFGHWRLAWRWKKKPPTFRVNYHKCVSIIEVVFFSRTLGEIIAQTSR